MRGWGRGTGAVGTVLLAVLGGCAASTPEGSLTSDVQAMLEQSARNWNAGDLDGFVSDYVDDSTTSFMAGPGPQYGFDWIRDNYASQFQPGAERDSLHFTNVAARPLGPGWALATARYVLTRGDSTTSTGPFTLVLHYVDHRWKIVHDHTTSD